jgi:hypothetical protein
VVVDDEDVVFSDGGGGFFAGDLALEFPLGGVVLEEVGEVVGRDEVVDGDDVDCFAEKALFYDGAKDEAPDTAEAIDSDFSHRFGGRDMGVLFLFVF